jgi:ELWxxDGT repeat protein
MDKHKNAAAPLLRWIGISLIASVAAWYGTMILGVGLNWLLLGWVGSLLDGVPVLAVSLGLALVALHGCVFALISGTIEARWQLAGRPGTRWPWLLPHVIGFALLYPFLRQIDVGHISSGTIVIAGLVWGIKALALRSYVDRPGRWAAASSAGLMLALLAIGWFSFSRFMPAKNGSGSVGSPVGHEYDPPRLLRPSGDQLLLSASDGQGGMVAWRSDGTAAGTTPLQAPQPGLKINAIASAGDRLVASAIQADDELFWSFDGAPQRAAVLLRLPRYWQPASALQVMALNGDTALLQSSNGLLWRTDGTANGTRLISPFVRSAKLLTRVDDAIFFVRMRTIISGDAYQKRAELWRTDGTAGSTRRIGSFAEVYAVYGSVALDGALYFSASDDIHGRELWVTDGTPEGTRMIKDIRPDLDCACPYWLTRAGDQVFFVADDGLHGFELWRSDGTADGTTMVSDINAGHSSAFEYSSNGQPPAIVAAADGVYFTANDGEHGFELWRSDGTRAGTRMVADIRPYALSSTPAWLTDADGAVYFSADDGEHGFELWRSDGTADGTALVKDIWLDETITHGPPSELTMVGATLFFVADDGEHGPELWRSDGTANGTALVKDFMPGR